MKPIYLLSEKIFDGARNLPVILIRHLRPSLSLSGYDALIFSSKNGVAAIDALDRSWRTIPAFSIGSGTSAAIRERGGELTYEARSSYGDDFAKEIGARLRGKRVLFLRAKVVTSSLNEILRQNGVLLEEAIVYETVCNDCSQLKPPPKGASIIFSSPSTITCFFRCFAWDPSYRAIVIGKRTASAMPPSIPYKIAPRPSIPACIAYARTLSEEAL